jgi:hypothetical protein
VIVVAASDLWWPVIVIRICRVSNRMLPVVGAVYPLAKVSSHAGNRLPALETQLTRGVGEMLRQREPTKLPPPSVWPVEKVSASTTTVSLSVTPSQFPLVQS